MARIALRFVGILVGAVALAACTGGDGELVTNTSVGRDDPGVTGDPPPSTRDTPGGACIVCDVNYNCSGPAPIGGGQLELSTSDGSCVQSLIDVICSGALFGVSGCTGGGGGSFTCGDTTCTPGGSQVTVVVGSSGMVGTLNPIPPAAASGGPAGSMGFVPDAG